MLKAYLWTIAVLDIHMEKRQEPSSRLWKTVWHGRCVEFWWKTWRCSLAKCKPSTVIAACWSSSEVNLLPRSVTPGARKGWFRIQNHNQTSSWWAFGNQTSNLASLQSHNIEEEITNLKLGCLASRETSTNVHRLWSWPISFFQLNVTNFTPSNIHSMKTEPIIIIISNKMAAIFTLWH